MEVYSKEYLRKPTTRDIEKLYAYHEKKHDLLGMIGSLDCTHWEWDNFPNAWRCQYTRGDVGASSVILEAVASSDLWIWHAYFSPAGSHNDINVLQQSPIFNDILTGQVPDMSFNVNAREYKHGYYLRDGIYPDYATFVKAFTLPRTEKAELFTKVQESARKDIGRAFGVLKKKWHVVKHGSRLWDTAMVTTILYACVILHNMVVESKGRAISKYKEADGLIPPQQFVPDTNEFLQRVIEIQSGETCYYLREDLTEHLAQTNNLV